MIEHAVVIAGGGPTGLMLAGELAGVDVAIVERRADQSLAGSRACPRRKLRPGRGRAFRPCPEAEIPNVSGWLAAKSGA